MAAAPGDDVRAEEALLAAARRGERRALERLLQRLAPRVLAGCRAVLGPAHPDVEDAAQEALLALAGALPRFRGECSLAHYAARVTARVAMQQLRRWRRGHPPGPHEAERPAALASDPEAEVLAGRRRELVRDLLAELPEAQAEVLLMRVVLGMRPAEVAAATGVPVNTVRSRLRLARQALEQRWPRDLDDPTGEASG